MIRLNKCHVVCRLTGRLHPSLVSPEHDHQVLEKRRFQCPSSMPEHPNRRPLDRGPRVVGYPNVPKLHPAGPMGPCLSVPLARVHWQGSWRSTTPFAHLLNNPLQAHLCAEIHRSYPCDAVRPRSGQRPCRATGFPQERFSGHRPRWACRPRFVQVSTAPLETQWRRYLGNFVSGPAHASAPCEFRYQSAPFAIQWRDTSGHLEFVLSTTYCVHASPFRNSVTLRRVRGKS